MTTSNQRRRRRSRQRTATPLSRLGPWAGDSDSINVVVETTRGRRNKFKFDEKLQVFRLSSVLPAGSNFPYDFGYIPGTLGEDGDPIDVLLLLDEPAFAGCLVKARLVGVLECEQEENGVTTRNDRFIAVAEEAHDYGNVTSLRTLNANLMKELVQFFDSSQAAKGRTFKLLGCRGPKRAIRLVQTSFRSGKKSRSPR